MKPIHWFPLLGCVLGLVLAPRLLLANAQPWDEQEAEKNAQEEITSQERSAAEEMSSSIYGRITSIDLNTKILSLLPTDEVENKEEEEEDEDASQDFFFNSETTLTGVDELSDLAVDDYVTLDYYTFRDKNRVTGITFDKPEENENENGNSKAKGNSPGILVG